MTQDEQTASATRGDPAALAELIVRSATDFAIVTFDPRGRITSWSPGAEKIMGWTAPQAIGRDVDLFFTPEDVAAGQARTEMARARDGGCATDERWHVKADGSRFWASGELQPLTEGGELLGYVKILRDRTEHREMQRRLEAAQAEAQAASERLRGEGRRLRQLFEAAPGFIAILHGPTHIFELVNTAYLQLVGHRHMIGLPVREALPEVEGQGFFEMLGRVYATGERINLSSAPLLVQREPGAAPEQRFVSFVYEPMRDADGSVSGIFVEGFDVTDAVESRAAADKLAAEQAAILSQLAEGVIATDAEGRIRFANAAAERLHGVARLDVAPDEYSDTYRLLTEDGAPYPPAELPLARAVVRGETVTDARWRIRRPDGSEVVAIGSARPVVADGAQVGAVLTVRDDTDRSAAERALARSEAASRNVLEGMDEGFVTVDRTFRILEINAEGLRIDGRSRDEIVGRHLLDVWPETERLPNWALFQQVLRDGKPGSVEYRHTSDVHDVWLETRAYPVDGGLAIFYRDVTDRRRAGDAVRASEARFQAITDSIDQMIWSTTPDGAHDYFNRRWYEYTGVPEGSTDGEAWLGIFHPDDQARTEARWRRSLDTGEPYVIEYRLRHRSGEYRWVAGRAQPVRDRTDDGTPGAILRWYGTCTDIHDVKIAEGRLRETEERYRIAVDATTDAVWDWDFATGHVLWNEAVHRAFGYAPGEVEPTGEWWIGHVHPDDRGRVDASIHAAIDGVGTQWSDEYRFLRADGSYADVLDRGAVIRDEAGRATRMIGAMFDLTERKRAEAAVRASEERYRTLFDAIDAGFCILEIGYGEDGRANDYRMTEVNPAFARQTGLADAAGRWVRELVDIEQHWIDFYAEVARTRVPARQESGSEALGRWFDVYAFPVRDADGERVAVLFNDISDRKNAELRLQELNRTLESRVAETVAERDMIWRTSQDLFAVIDAQARYVSLNPAWTDALGYPVEELIGRSSLELVHPDDVERTVAEFGRVAKGEIVRSVDLRTRHKDGRYRVFSWTAVPSRGALYASGRDVTERRELEDQLRQSQKMEAVGQLTGGIAHDFNNLLTIVSGNIDMAKRSLGADGDARALRSLGNAAKGADRAAALTQRLLAFSRRQPLQPRATDVNKLVTGMTELLDRALGETVELQVVAGAGLWRVEVDPNQLENAILNLAVNARDAMSGEGGPTGGKLTIETTNSMIDEAYAAQANEVAPGQYVLISVTDTGEGMPPEVVAKAFDPFFSTKEVGKGTGLGLSQVYGYVKQSGGHVAIYSEAGHGTTIKLYLPRLIAEMNAGEEEEAEALPALQGQETILVVEDDDDVRIYTVDSLRELGYRVLEAHDGASALRLLERQEEPVKLLLTDVVMPGMSGRELADQARAAWPEMQVLFTTGYARNAIVHGGRLDPGVELLPKPFTYDALAAKVREVLEKVGVERALVLDPSADARDLAIATLKRLGLEGEPAATVREALGKLRAMGGMFDLVVLSDTLPVGNLDAVIAELHAVRAALPILILSAAAADALAARYADRPCVAATATPVTEDMLRDRLEVLKVRCARAA